MSALRDVPAWWPCATCRGAGRGFCEQDRTCYADDGPEDVANDLTLPACDPAIGLDLVL